MCVLTFQNDLEYWGLPDSLMESCCKEKYEADLLFVLAVWLVGEQGDLCNVPHHSGDGGPVRGHAGGHPGYIQ